MSFIIGSPRARPLPMLVEKTVPPATERLWDWLAIAALLAAAVVIALTFTDYGVTWDEDVHNWYGYFALDYYLSLFTDERALNWLNLYNYGAAFDMIAAALNKFSPLGVYETRHLLNGFVGLVGLLGCWKLGRVLGGARTGFIALLFLLLTPNYYGQMFNNPKDIPFAVGGVASHGRAAAERLNHGGTDEPVASAAAGRRRGLRRHAGVLALGATRPDR